MYTRIVSVHKNSKRAKAYSKVNSHKSKCKSYFKPTWSQDPAQVMALYTDYIYKDHLTNYPQTFNDIHPYIISLFNVPLFK